MGDSDAGKTAYVRALRNTGYNTKYIPTIGVEVHPVVFRVDDVPVCLNIWDTAGSEKFGGLRHGYYIGADAAIAMYRYGSYPSLIQCISYITDVKKVCGNIPIVVVASKCDLQSEDPDIISIGEKISVQSGSDIHAPINKVLSQLLKKTAVVATNSSGERKQEIISEIEDLLSELRFTQ